MKFFFVYKSLQHPELEGEYVQPFTLEERTIHARHAAKQLDSTIPWLVDSMDNRAKQALRSQATSEFIIDPKGIIVAKRIWNDPDELRKDLEKFVGPVEKITKPEDLNLKVERPLTVSAPKGVIERVSRSGMFPIFAIPEIEKDGVPFYAKLRAESEITVIDEGKGKLYLGFHLDPFHQAHWNNLRKPLRFQLDLPEGVILTQKSGEAIRPEDAETDRDPREFLLDVEAWPDDKIIRLTVTYSACTEKLCHEVRQVYNLRREQDREGGSSPGQGFRSFSLERMVKLLMDGDKNGDGKLTKEELNSMMRYRFADYDLDKDGVLDTNEIAKAAEQQIGQNRPQAPPTKGVVTVPAGCFDRH